MHAPEGDLKEFIIDSGLVAKKEIDAAALEAQKHGKSLGEVLVSRGALTEDALRRIQSYVLGIPFVSLEGQHIPTEVLALIPEPITRTHNIIAYKKGDHGLEIALLDMDDLASIDSVRQKTGLSIHPRLTDSGSIKHALLQYQKALKKEFGDIISTEVGNIRGGSGDDLRNRAEELPVVRLVDTLLRHAIVQGASDIHIEPMENEVLVRYRIDGKLHDAMTLPKLAAAGILARIKVLANLALEEERLPQDGRFVMETEADRVSLRVSILPTFFGEKIVMRLLRETAEGFTLEVLGLHGENLERVHQALSQRTGIVLVAGPSGSGKTTTLYTLLDILNKPQANISTIEDPIEYQMKRVNQTQVSAEAGLTFAAGLRALMRQDPDIIMIGEIRDAETASLAVAAAQSGRLVLASIDALSAAGALERLMGMGVPPRLLASALRVIVAQRLVRKLSENKEAYAMDKSARDAIAPDTDFARAFKALEEEKLVKKGSRISDLPFYRAVPGQSDDGYRGRIGIHEVLLLSPAMRALILSSGSSAEIKEQAEQDAVLTLVQDGLYKAAQGMTSVEEVPRAPVEPR